VLEGKEIMPNYDLRCAVCHTEHNIRASMAEKGEKRIPCPDCGSFEMETVFKSPPAHIMGKSAPRAAGPHGCRECPHAG